MNLATKGLPLLSFLGLAIYALVRNGYDAYYAVDETTPDEVGLTEVTIIGHAGVALVFLGLLVAMVGMVPAAVIWWTLNGVLPKTRAHYGTLILVSVALLALVACQVLLLQQHQTYLRYEKQFRSLPELRQSLDAHFPQPFTGIQPTHLVTGFMVLLLLAIVLRLIAAKESWTGRNRIPVGFLQIVVAASLAGVAITLFVLGGAYGATRSLIHSPDNPLDPYLASIFDFQAPDVCATWVGGGKQPAALDMSDSVEYLGRSDGETVLFQNGKGIGAVRIPSGSVVLTPYRLDTRRCP